MAAENILPECLFCRATRSMPDDLEWHDRPLAHVPGIGAVIPGLGAFVPGYVLVFPEQHVESTIRIPAAVGPAFADLLSRTVSSVTEVFGPATVFEHGSCSLRNVRRSACLDHAHTHVIPGVYGLSNAMREVLNPFSEHPIRNLEAHMGYLMLDEPPHGPRYGPDPGISQYLRRGIAAKVGVPDEWDYLLFPRLKNVRETVRVLSGRIAMAQIIEHGVT
jgi:diadenosine tetraphosphate (Ap4A) HIT family hydrolase